jgi:hypothetical protein
MRVYRRYRCDFGHEWTLPRQDDEPERKEDTYCPEGHEAVTCKEEQPADEVQVLLRPAARIVDRVKGQVALSGRYWLLLLDRFDKTLCVSSRDYSWDEAVRLAGLFKGKDHVQAMEWWSRESP